MGLAAMGSLVFVSANLLGDCLCTTPTVRALRRKHPSAFVTYIAHNEEHCRILEGNPDIDNLVFSDELSANPYSVVDQAFLHRSGVQWSEPLRIYRFDVHALHRSRSDIFQDHICRGFAGMCGVQVDSVRPIVSINEQELAAARALVCRRAIVLGMHSTSPMIGRDGEFAMKDWLLERWLRLAQRLNTRGFEIIAVGSARDFPVSSRHFRSLYRLPIKVLAALVREAACVITVESGLSHLCYAVDAPTVVIFSQDVPLAWSRPEGTNRCRVIYDDVREITCDRVMAALESVLAMAPPVSSSFP